MSFRHYNPNPEQNRVGDCTVRAVSKALNESWDDAYDRLCAKGFELGDMPSADAVWGAALISVGFRVATENCADRAAASENTRDILEAIGSKTQTVLDKLCQLELDGVRQNYENRIAGLENALSQSRANEQSLRFAASQANQNALFRQGMNDEVDALYNRLNNCPVNTVPVYGKQPIFTCPGNGGCGYGYAA